MANKYVNFISDKHLLTCVENLYKSYLKAKNNISKKSFYTNKVDTIKLTFDAKFTSINEDDLIQSEKNGYLVENGNINLLSTTLIKALQLEPNSYLSMVDFNKQLINNFHVSCLVDKWIDIL